MEQIKLAGKTSIRCKASVMQYGGFRLLLPQIIKSNIWCPDSLDDAALNRVRQVGLIETNQPFVGSRKPEDWLTACSQDCSAPLKSPKRKRALPEVRAEGL